MRKILLKFKKLFAVAIITGLMSSCIVTQTNVGKYREAKGTEYTYSKAKQMWVLYGLIPVGKTHTETPADGQCQINTQFRLIDVLAIVFTAGIFGMQTIKVKAKR
jgi:hypothetical protein